MQLWYTPTSPFARKTRIAAHELDLADRIALVPVDPWTDARLRALNPLAKVPTLVLDDGEVLYESTALCDYLDELAGGGKLIPAAGPVRRRALRLQGLADGAATAAGRLFADERRPPGERSEGMMRRFVQAIETALDGLEATPLDAERPQLGEVAAAAFASYLDFRWPARDWRQGRPALARWLAAMEARPSMQATRYALKAG